MPEENDQDRQLEEKMAAKMEEEAAETGSEETKPAADAEAPAEEAQAETGEDAKAGPEADMLQALMEETGDPESTLETAVQGPIPAGAIATQPGANQLMDVSIAVSIELGHTEVAIHTLLGWTEGSLIELDKVSGDAVDVLINGKKYAIGEVITIAENFGVRLIEIYTPGSGG